MIRSFLTTVLMTAIGAAASSATAEELRVLGPSGLTRAFAQIQGSAKVEVSLAKTSVERGVHPSALTLINVDGLGAEIPAKGGTDGLFLFSQVPGGSWQVKLSDEDVQLRRVTIIKRQSNIADVEMKP